MKRAVPLGLIVNELITDSLKHAFPEGRDGTIVLALGRAGDSVVLSVSDDGIGLPPGFEPGSATGFGLNLVGILSSQLKAELEIGSGTGGRGASFSISFRL